MLTLSSAFLFSIMTITVNAQIVHSDIADPWALSIFIDFDSDGNPEFEVGSFGAGLFYGDYGTDNSVCIFNDGNSRVYSVSEGSSIDGTLNWATQGPSYLDGSDFSGNSSVTDGEDNYIAVRFNLTGSSDIYYGWIRFNSVSLHDLDIQYIDYAYNTNAGEPINAGDQGGSSGIKKESTIQVALYPNPTTDFLNIKGADATYDYVIVNVLGDKVMSGNAVSKSVNVEGLNKGVYFIQLTRNKDGKMANQRFIKK